MAFSEEVFPLTEAYGSVGGPGFMNQMVRVDSGVAETTTAWQAPLMQYDITSGLRGEATLYQVYNFFMAHKGSAIGFRFLDRTDHASTADGKTVATNGLVDPTDTDQLIGAGDGSKTAFQLEKDYTEGSTVMTRPITKPIAGTVIISVDGTGTAAFSVDNTTGLVTMDVAPASGLAVKAGYQFHVPAQFSPEVDKLMSISAVDFESQDIQSLPIIEQRTPVAYDLRHSFGGAKNHGSITANVSVNLADGNFQTFDPTTGGPLQVRLPLEGGFTPGLGFWTFENANATNTLEVADSAGVALFGNSIIGTSSFGDVHMGLSGAGVKLWRLVT